MSKTQVQRIGVVSKHPRLIDQVRRMSPRVSSLSDDDESHVDALLHEAQRAEREIRSSPSPARFSPRPFLVPPDPPEPSSSAEGDVLQGEAAVDGDEEDEYVGNSLMVAAERSRESERQAVMRVLRQHTNTLRAEMSLDGRRRPPHEQYTSYCFPCETGNMEFDSSDKGCRPILRLREMIEGGYESSCEVSLAIRLSNYYNANLYYESWNPDLGCYMLPPMPVDRWLGHITGSHHLDATLMVGQSLRTTVDALAFTKSKFVKPNGDMNMDAMKMWKMFAEEQRKFLSLPRNKLFFGGSGNNASGMNMDPSKMGNVINVRGMTHFMKPASDAIGGATAADTTAVNNTRRDFTSHRQPLDSEELPM